MTKRKEQDRQVEWIRSPEGTIRGLRYEEPLEDGWYVNAEFRIYHDLGHSPDLDAAELVLVEVKVFPGGHRQRFTERKRGQRVPCPTPGQWTDDEHLFHGVDPAGLTSRLLRSVRIGEIISAARRGLEEVMEHPRGSDLAGLLLELPVARPGRAGRDDAFYLPWAIRYAEKVAAGSRAPISELAAETGAKREMVRDLVYKARDRKLLTKRDAKGRAGGQLTDTARELLAQMQKAE